MEEVTKKEIIKKIFLYVETDKKQVRESCLNFLKKLNINKKNIKKIYNGIKKNQREV